jgi:hypothetical protein
MNLNDIKQQINANHITVLEHLVKQNEDRRKLIVDFLNQHDISIESAIDCLYTENMFIQERQRSILQHQMLKDITKNIDPTA